jgi:hypothetical protein
MMDAVQKLSEWKAATNGKSGEGLEVRVEMILRVYHLKQASETEERVRLLGELAKICREYIAEKLPTDPLYGAFVLLGAQADKQITIIQHAKGGWATLKRPSAPPRTVMDRRRRFRIINRLPRTPRAFGTIG